MKYWLLKTEPNEWSWKHQIESGSKGAVWDGVRNYQARNNLKICVGLRSLNEWGDGRIYLFLAKKSGNGTGVLGVC